MITKETKERFVRMLKRMEIIVFQCKKNSRRLTYDFKFIGANSCGKWDFNPLIEQATHGYYSYRANGDYSLAIRATDSAAVICEVLDDLKKEGIEHNLGSGQAMYEKVRHLLTTFYL